MTIAKIRRKLNDSKIGQKLNDSYLGILVEGTSRGINDCMDVLMYNAIGTGCAIHGLLSRKKSPIIEAVMLGVIIPLAGGPVPIERKKHYSHTSRLYEAGTDANGNQLMYPVNMGEALLTKLSEKHPELAQRLCLSYSLGRK